MYSRHSLMTHQIMLILAVMVLVASVASVKDDNTDSPLVRRTRQGFVRGSYQKSSSGRSLLAFYNVPYAKPPVGALRFRDPLPPEIWSDVRNATTPGSDCVQWDDFFTRGRVSGSEDCLYLNIFTPQLLRSRLLPVMFWIHGGGFVYGGGKAYGPDFLLNHDIVLVTINYRLGPFGLFQRVIMQSGTAFSWWAVARTGVAANNSDILANVLGCPTHTTIDMVDCLRNIDEYVLAKSQRYLKKWYVDPIIAIQPVVEGERAGSFLPEDPLHLKPHNLEWIIGVNENEGAFRSADMYQNITLLKEFAANFSKLAPIALYYDTVQNADFITEKIRNFYLPLGIIYARPLTDIFSDSMFIWNSDEAVRLYKNVTSVFYYLFTYKGKYRTADPFRTIDFDFGAAHTDDLFYLFPNNPFYPENYTLPKEDMNMVHTITKLWTNFAKAGNPAPDCDPAYWPAVLSDDKLEYLEIGQQLNTRKGLAQERMEFWRSAPFR